MKYFRYYKRRNGISGGVIKGIASSSWDSHKKLKNELLS